VKLTHQEGKILVGTAFAALLVLLIRPGQAALTRDTVLAVAPTEGFIGLGLSEAPNLDPAQYNWAELNFGSQIPGSASNASLRIWVRLNTASEASEAAVVVLGEQYGAALRSCDDESTDVNRDLAYEELETTAKRLATAASRRELKMESGQDSDPTDAEVVGRAASGRYTELTLPYREATEKSNDGKSETHYLYAYDECAFDNSAFWWSNGSSDFRFQFPALAYVEPADYPSTAIKSEAEASVPSSPQLSLLRWDPAPESQQGSGRTNALDEKRYKWRFAETNDTTFSDRTSDGARSAALDPIAGVFRDNVLEDRAQKALFTSGVALGILGGLIVGLFPELYDAVALRAAGRRRHLGEPDPDERETS